MVRKLGCSLVLQLFVVWKSSQPLLLVCMVYYFMRCCAVTTWIMNKELSKYSCKNVYIYMYTPNISWSRCHVEKILKTLQNMQIILLRKHFAGFQPNKATFMLSILSKTFCYIFVRDLFVRAFVNYIRKAEFKSCGTLCNNNEVCSRTVDCC